MKIAEGGAPDVLALDFDGVLCEGSREYFETSRRTYARTWPGAIPPGDDLLPQFRELRPVIEHGWEMPLLLKGIAGGTPEARVRAGWPTVRDLLLDGGPGDRDEVVAQLRATLDDVRREWIGHDARDWLAHHAPYCDLDELRRVLASPGRVVIVTTKEGEFTRRIVEHWGLVVASIEGKETGSHKCDTLRTVIRDHRAVHGRPPSLWFVEDRLETLRCVSTHADLDAVQLFLAAWGYTTPEARAAAETGHRIRLLTLEAFRAGPARWSEPRTPAEVRHSRDTV